MAFSGVPRRLVWTAIAVVILLALAAGGLTWAVAGSHRRSDAAVVLVPPTFGSSIGQENPLLHLKDVVPLAGALRIALGSQEVHNHVGDGASYRVGGGPGGDLSPMLVITATGATAERTEHVAQALISWARRELDALQARTQVPDAARVDLLVVSAPRSGRSVGTRPWVLAAVTTFVVLATGLLAAAADLARRRRPFRPSHNSVHPSRQAAAEARPRLRSKTAQASARQPRSR